MRGQSVAIEEKRLKKSARPAAAHLEKNSMRRSTGSAVIAKEQRSWALRN
jgi:hypothetical protein